ncbi:MAG: hypothetical protein J7M03_00955 [Candidatus Desulfofervidaceae bacterium]|nr:hypothetical protein [Candidatus Desulfofervidaceae bacterium]MDL1971220.1 hypothetical protein [Candidatus Desulfofervidaceae bacterium]
MAKHIRKEIEEEREIITHAGELPEVALYASLYYLTEDPEGPHLVLTPEEVAFLKEGVIEGYKKIILRDLNLKMRGENIFRGTERAIINYRRLKRFAKKERIGINNLIPEIAQALITYMEIEIKDPYLKTHSLRTVNCSKKDWEWFIKELNLTPSHLLPEPEAFFKRTPLSFKETITLFRKRKKKNEGH